MFKNLTLAKTLPFILLIAGIIGYAMAFIIMYEKLQLADNPHYIPSCNLNPVISCGNVMKSPQSHIFGFSNPMLGLAAYPVLAVVGAGMLAGARYRRWFWLGLQAGLVFGLGFVHWLFFQTVYRIHALCPYCIGVWIVTITSFWYVLLYNIDTGHIRLPARLQPLYDRLRSNHLGVLVVWFLIIAGLILKHFWYYYGRNL